jgi:hypothetical protein
MRVGKENGRGELAGYMQLRRGLRGDGGWVVQKRRIMVTEGDTEERNCTKGAETSIRNGVIVVRVRPRTDFAPSLEGKGGCRNAPRLSVLPRAL